ncbi:hypothetical protein [Streptomyces sp. NPDC056105]|uniref:hypothetical protein n=1 Tax=Streptomyces sp. NPDC056105 TaxID=3345714 RepID=UPI0035E2FFBE
MPKVPLNLLRVPAPKSGDQAILKTPGVRVGIVDEPDAVTNHRVRLDAARAAAPHPGVLVAGALLRVGRDAADADCRQRGAVVQQNKAQWIPAGVIVLAVVIDLVTPTEVTSAPLIMAAPVAAAPLLTLPGATHCRDLTSFASPS